MVHTSQSSKDTGHGVNWKPIVFIYLFETSETKAIFNVTILKINSTSGLVDIIIFNMYQ